MSKMQMLVGDVFSNTSNIPQSIKKKHSLCQKKNKKKKHGIKYFRLLIAESIQPLMQGLSDIYLDK